MNTDRRSVLRWGLAGTLGVVLPTGTAVAASQRRRSRPVTAAGPRRADFRNPLRIPSVLQPVSTADGVDRYEIRQTAAPQQILADGPATTVWGYNGTFPGPTIVARRGRKVIVTHHNELTVPTVVHLHGGVVSPESDGYPTDFVMPVGSAEPDEATRGMAAGGVAGLTTGRRDYVYLNDQAAATLWYHDHRMDFTGPQVYRGLAGFYLLRDDAEEALPLPQGERDIPLMICDRNFAEDGSFDYPSRDHSLHSPGVPVQHQAGFLADVNVVNGVAWPFHEVDAALYRLRICNVSNARPYSLRLDPPPPGGHGLVQIGSDVGLLPRPVRHDLLFVSPGERYDVLVDFSAYEPGTQVVLKNDLELDEKSDIMRFDVARRVADDARVPDVLVPEAGAAPPPGNTPGDRRFNFTVGPPGNGLPGMINFQPFDIGRIDANPTLGTTEIWDITADSNHPVHLHMAHFRVISRNGGDPGPQDGGWKDTVFVTDSAVKLAVDFSGFRGKYVFHCHNLEHSDNGMMTNVQVI